MRNLTALLPRVVFILTTLYATVSQANGEQLIYRSIGHQTTTGDGKITHLTVKGFLVLDANVVNGNPVKATAVAGVTFHGVKFYTVVPLQKYQVATVSGPNGTNFTILAKAESPGTQFSGTLLEAVYLRGKNRNLTISPQSSVYLPRTFTSSARGISLNPQTNNKAVGEISVSYVLDSNETFVSNQLETFEQAVTRLSNGFAGRGYTQFFPTPAP